MLTLFCSKGTVHSTFSNGLYHHKHTFFHCSFLVQEQHQVAMNFSVVRCFPDPQFHHHHLHMYGQFVAAIH